MHEEKFFKIAPRKYMPKDNDGDLPTVAELHNVTMDKFYAKQQFWDLEEKNRKLYH